MEVIGQAPTAGSGGARQPGVCGPILAALLLALLTGCASLRDTRLDHRLPTPTTPTVDLGYYRSVQERSDGQSPELAVAAAVSGGGHRAGNFAMGVLLALEDLELDGRRYNLLKEIDYFSTVSGGGFAVGAYLSSLYDHLQAEDGGRNDYSLAAALAAHGGRMRVNLERDYHGTVFESLVSLKCLGYNDAGDILEHRLDRRVLGSAYRARKYSLTLGDLFRAREDTGPVLLPYWVANATVYENGARFPFTPDVLAGYHVTGFTHNMEREKTGGDTFRVPLAVGAKASASFPVAFPATTLSCADPRDSLNRFLHLMDGGLTDNMGYRTAIDLLRQDKAKHKVLLIIDAYKGVAHPRSADQRSPAGAEAAYRIMKISLDSDHSYLQSDVERLAQGESGGETENTIDVVFLDFAQLKPALSSEIADTKAELARLRGEKSRATARRIRRGFNAALEREEAQLQQAEATYALYDDARAVATSLNITRGEQQLLIRAGQAVVDRNRAILAQHIARHLERQ